MCAPTVSSHSWLILMRIYHTLAPYSCLWIEKRRKKQGKICWLLPFITCVSFPWLACPFSQGADFAHQLNCYVCNWYSHAHLMYYYSALLLSVNCNEIDVRFVCLLLLVFHSIEDWHRVSLNVRILRTNCIVPFLTDTHTHIWCTIACCSCLWIAMRVR